MRNPYQRKAASNIQKSTSSAKDQYIQFIQTIVSQTKLYVLYDEGWALCSTPSGQQTLAVWQTKGLAQLLIKDHWEHYQVQDVGLASFIEEMLPYIRQRQTHLSINLTPEGQNVLVSGEKFILDLKTYLYQLYLTEPALFENNRLPLPRKIRLNNK
ncbi:DUF2750 domain-containing protein [Acinetobacter sp. ANC 4648]|uniref:DUF2750 domain-containing protein n=1 Tax=Acinetobacter sp. ANC 4648 TaxID=1977875 RepID=UPI000A35A7B9|nr:DUF2750 domain-containing protein [Acinetobacter sp. ANC 4648]OTG83818.1 hypothetical protein B9T27_04760 [Acinetobacter sp. ANC 4648]